jgi:hypothetical protein
MSRKNQESTGKKAASAAGKTLSNPNASKAAKSAAASALTQYKSKEVTGAKAASNAGKTLANPNSSKAAKSAAASALTQRANKKK